MLQAASAIVKTVTGTLPLELSNAIYHHIVSLTRYGLCTQDGTPTLADPVPIKCNNGTLTAVDDYLPTGYKRVQGFSVNDDCYWRLTDFKLNGSDTLRFAFSVTAACNVIGAYSGSASGNNLSLYVAISGTGKYLRYKDGAYNSVIDTDTRYDVAITPTGSVGMKTDSTWDELSFTTTTDFCIGTTSTSTSSAKLKGSLFGNITVDGRLDLVPCERISDGVLGYYDLVGESFYAPTSGTPTSLGYDYDHVHVEVVGTPEVLTVSGKNLLNTATNITGYYIGSNGSVTAGIDAQYTDLIPVKEGETYVASLVSGRNNGTNRWHGYNANGGWVKQLAYVSASDQQGNKLVMTSMIDSGISYVRLSYGINDTEAMIERAYTTEFYESKSISRTGYLINTTEKIQSPYSGANRPGFLVEVTPGTTYYVLSNVTRNGIKVAAGNTDIGFYASIEDVTNVSSNLGCVVDNKFTAPSNANYAVVCFNAGPGTEYEYTFSYGVALCIDYQPYVEPQTASVPMLLSVGDVKDEVELIHGPFTRRVTACLYDGTQPVGDVYMSTTGGKDAGAIIVYPLATPTTESVTPQPLNTNEGTNIIESTSNVSPIDAEVEYAAKKGA